MEKKKYAVSNQTRQAMANALKELMAQKPIDKITIRDITDLCDMRRQNFYYHFQDIYDLMHWMFQQEAVSLLEPMRVAFRRPREYETSLSGKNLCGYPPHGRTDCERKRLHRSRNHQRRY